MFMRISKHHLLSWAGMAVLASTGLMQGAQHGTFHLRTAAYWGQVLLQPGDYKIFLPDPSLDQAEFRIQGAAKTVFELPVITGEQPNSSSSYLKLSEVDGNYFVREFSSGVTGKKYIFPVPKVRGQQTANATGSSVIVGIN
jgi:hypothetical protein